MLIRSQDHEKIMNFTGASVGIDRELSKDNNICITIFYSENTYEELGEYSTKEKALKVLDMIQAAYEKYEYEKVFKTGTTLLETFQMPDDSEVGK